MNENDLLKNIKDFKSFMDIYNKIQESDCELVFHDEEAPLGCERLGQDNYDICIDDKTAKSFEVYYCGEYTKTVYYKNVHKIFTVIHKEKPGKLRNNIIGL